MQKTVIFSGLTLVKTKRMILPRSADIHEYVQNMYFENPSGCVPTEYLGEDVMNDIHTKFYYPLAFLVWCFQKMHPELNKDSLLITIDPSYDCATNFILHLFEQKITLLQGSWNAWSFWFKSEADFEDWMDDCFEEMENCFRNKEE
jgi:hypothetical protein